MFTTPSGPTPSSFPIGHRFSLQYGLPIKLQLSDFERYVGDLHLSTDFMIPDSITYRNTKYSYLHRSLSYFEPIEKG